MIYYMVVGHEIHTQLSLMVDLAISCLIVASGLCLSLIMFKLYTYLQCWSIYLHQQRSNFNNAERLNATHKQQQHAQRQFNILKYSLHALMICATIYIVTQLSLIYTHSAFGGQSPLQVSSYAFAQS